MVQLTPARLGVVPGTGLIAGALPKRLGGAGLVALVVAIQLITMLAFVAVWPGQLVGRVVLVGVAVIALTRAGILGHQVTLSALDRLPQLIMSFIAAAGVVATGMLLLGSQTAAIEVLQFWPFAAAVSWLALSLTYAIGRAARSRGWFLDRAVVLGTGDVAERLEYGLATQPELGLDLIGSVTANPMDSPASRVIGKPEDLLTVCQAYDADVVIVAHAWASDPTLQGPIRQALADRRRVLVVPRFHEDLNRHQAGYSVRDIPLQPLPRPNSGVVRHVVKRAIDVTLAGLALLALSPVLAVCAIAARRETGGVLFRQVRVGKNEQPVAILKFQTLKPATTSEGDTTWNISHDDRVGPAGRFMRKTSLDELPQLWNIVRGDMSLVGPRPERPFFVEQFKETVPGYADRHRVQVGLTGWAQVHRLRGDSSIDERVRFDNVYVASWSPWEDVKIMLRTIPEVFRKSGG